MASLFGKQSSKQKQNVKRSNIIEFFAALLILVFLNILGNYFFARFDLTSEKRYTLAPTTKKLLKNLDDIVYFKVYLEGDFPSDFKRLRNETREMLNQFRAYSNNIEYEFQNANDIPEADRRVFYQKMAEKGFLPTTVNVQDGSGGMTTLIIFPYAEVRYRGRETQVELLKSQRYDSDENMLNHSIESLEYVLTDAIRRLSIDKKETVAFLKGHGEIDNYGILDIQIALSEYYNIENVEINGEINSLTERTPKAGDSSQYVYKNKYKALIIPKPTQPFSDKDLFIIDQYVMRGGNILWLIDPLDVTMDSLQHQNQTLAAGRPLRIESQLFKYGIRVNTNLVMDINCLPIPMTTGTVGEKPKISFVPFYYFPELLPASNHPIVRNLNAVKSEFVSSIDVIESPVKKTVLLSTSRFSRILNAPVQVNLYESARAPEKRLYNKHFVPVAMLLEGIFPSAWLNRLPPELTDAPEIGYLKESIPSKMIVVADGDVIRNQYNYRDDSPFPLGYDQYTQTMYGNKDFVLNCVNYLCDDEDFLSTRAREISLRKLDTVQLKEKRTAYTIINISLPILLVAVFGVILFFIRKRLYAR